MTVDIVPPSKIQKTYDDFKRNVTKMMMVEKYHEIQLSLTNRTLVEVLEDVNSDVWCQIMERSSTDDALKLWKCLLFTRSFYNFASSVGGRKAFDALFYETIKNVNVTFPMLDKTVKKILCGLDGKKTLNKGAPALTTFLRNLFTNYNYKEGLKHASVNVLGTTNKGFCRQTRRYNNNDVVKEGEKRIGGSKKRTYRLGWEPSIEWKDHTDEVIVSMFACFTFKPDYQGRYSYMPTEFKGSENMSKKQPKLIVSLKNDPNANVRFFFDENGLLGRSKEEDDKPSIVYTDGKDVKVKMYCQRGVLSRPNGKPAIVGYSNKREYYVNGLRSNARGPAIVYANGNEEFFTKGKRDRPWNEGPAVRNVKGNNKVLESFWENGVLHRPSLDGPAMTYRNGDVEYWERGVLSNLMGPAVVKKSEGEEKYYIDGICYGNAETSDYTKEASKRIAKRLEKEGLGY